MKNEADGGTSLIPMKHLELYSQGLQNHSNSFIIFSEKKKKFVGKFSTFILSSHLSISNPICSILFIKNFSNFSFTEVGFYAKCQWHRRSCSECLRMFATEIQAGKTRHNG